MANDIDIMAARNITKKHTTMFEVNDEDREHEYHGEKYISSFVEFIESLGFNVGEKDYPGSKNIIINGVKFNINVDNASFMARSAYDRKGHERKPQNRFISITKTYGDKCIVKIPFNKEIEADKIKTKINAAIKAHHDREIEIKNRDKRDEENTIAIGAHYLSHPFLKIAIEYIHIEKGIISFSFKDYFTVQFKENNFVNASFHAKEMKSGDDVFSFIDTIGPKMTNFETAFHELLLSKKLPDYLIEWANSQYHKYFYSATMSTDRQNNNL